MMVRKSLALLAVSGLVMSLFLAACGTSNFASPPIPKPKHPTAADYPIVWIPTPNLDLNSADGTFVRAIAEPEYRSEWLDWAGTSPGWLQAYQPMYSPGSVTEGDHVVYYNRYRPPPKPHITYMWAAPFPTGDPHSYYPPGARPVNNQYWSAPNKEIGGVAVCFKSTVAGYSDKSVLEFFTYRREGIPPPADQHGSRAMPNSNVFGGWHTLNLLDVGGDNPGDGFYYPKLSQRCKNPPIPITPAMRPSSPGWPGKGQ